MQTHLKPKKRRQTMLLKPYKISEDLISCDRPLGKIMHLPKYCVCRSEEFRYPFNMQDMIAARIITIDQRDNYMKMLNSCDVEMENLAVNILRKLKEKLEI